MRPWRPPFHASPAARKGPISSKRVSSQDPLLRKFGNFSLNSLNFHPNFSSQAPNLEIFSSQAPKFGNFQLTSPQIWKISAHKPPFSEANVSSQAPHFGNPGRTPLPEKKLSAPPPGPMSCNEGTLFKERMFSLSCWLELVGEYVDKTYRFPIWFHLKLPIKNKCTLPITKLYKTRYIITKHFFMYVLHECTFSLILREITHVKDLHCLALRSIHSLKVAQS